VPNDTEWTTLTTFLGGASVAGGKMKATGTTLWAAPNSAATNSSGFTGLPGAYRVSNGTFDNFGNYGTWWSSSESNIKEAWVRFLGYNYGFANRNFFDKPNGVSVRCLRD
jgi:uncharacterized protein (TIGR02145 family)